VSRKDLTSLNSYWSFTLTAASTKFLFKDIHITTFASHHRSRITCPLISQHPFYCTHITSPVHIVTPTLWVTPYHTHIITPIFLHQTYVTILGSPHPLHWSTSILQLWFCQLYLTEFGVLVPNPKSVFVHHVQFFSYKLFMSSQLLLIISLHYFKYRFMVYKTRLNHNIQRGHLIWWYQNQEMFVMNEFCRLLRGLTVWTSLIASAYVIAQGLLSKHLHVKTWFGILMMFVYIRFIA